MQATGEAVQDFVAFAEEKTRDGSITKKHLIIPTWRRIKKWLIGIFGNDDSTGEDSPDVMERGGNVVFLGHGWKQKKDPEHLPPTTTWEKIGNGLRNFSHFFGSPESVFGFRVACATMTVGVVAFLEQTQQFFIQQRLVWGMIIIAIGMTQSMLLEPHCLWILNEMMILTARYHSLWPIYIWLLLSNRRYIHRHGKLFYYLVYRRLSNSWRHCLYVAVHLCRVLFFL